ncbi:glycosyltransferase [Marinilactibacillus sp. XAAS-LB27]|uniref:glycosyltransferase n=1 Tax=Marinilactibacillus sp. XAAS-LB27 TaxID=3114538 RepID=UPI002E197F51|nr:glycosyltransferase [Marinilactibacillus sp. XAAS-LB27]
MKKILNVIGSLNTGGAEINTMNVFKNLKLDKYTYEFLVFDQSPGYFEEEAINYGAIIKRIIEPKKDYKKFIKDFDKLLRENSYDVIHVNTLWNSGLLLKLAYKNHIPIRICHSHSTESSANENFKYKLYKRAMKYLIAKSGTDFVACGKEAGAYLYGERNFEDNGEIIYNGVDLDKFNYDIRLRKKIRSGLGITEETFVIGHIGRMAPVKNQKFIVDVCEVLTRKSINIKFVLVGDGPDFSKIKSYIQKKKLEPYFLLLGNRDDISDLTQAIDLIMFPSLYEGFPVSLIEAQASSLPCLVSTGVTQEALLLKESKRLPLIEKNQWVEVIKTYMDNRNLRTNIDTRLITENFNIKDIASKWEKIYDR